MVSSSKRQKNSSQWGNVAVESSKSIQKFAVVKSQEIKYELDKSMEGKKGHCVQKITG